MAFEDLEAESTILGGIFEHGEDAYLDSSDYTRVDDFSDDLNQCVYAAFKNHFEGGESRKVDWPTLLSIFKKLGMEKHISTDSEERHVRSLMNYGRNVELTSVRPASAKLLKLRVGRDFSETLRRAQIDLTKITGEEALNAILSMGETPVMDFVQGLSDENLNSSTHIADGMRDWLEDVFENPSKNVGIPLPFSTWNIQTGGGCHECAVSVVAARAGVGKSTFGNQACLEAAGKFDVSCFNVDTEMTQKDLRFRILGNMTGVDVNDIKFGRLDEAQKDRLREAVIELERIPYHYKGVADLTFEEQIAAMRRWLAKDVGVDENGQRKRSLIVYDYLQVMEAKAGDLKEYQLLGYYMVALIRLASKYNAAILAFIQMNRDGEESESSASIAGSDRVYWKAASLSLLKRKTPEEIQEDGEENGNVKLIVIKSRFGEGSNGNYISIKFDGATARLVEGKTRFQILKERGIRPSTDKKFEAKGQSKRKLKRPKIENQHPDSIL